MRVASWFFGRKGHPYKKMEVALSRLLATVDGIEHEAFHDKDILSSDILATFDVLITYTQHAPGKELETGEEDALFSFVESGGGFVGIHGATASFKTNPRYHEFLGGRFTGHGLPCKIHARVVDRDHPVTAGLGMATFSLKDEPYDHELLDERVHVLVDRDGKRGTAPMAWIKEHGKGRIVYIAFGHYTKVLEHPAVRGLVLGAVSWATRG